MVMVLGVCGRRRLLLRLLFVLCMRWCVGERASVSECCAARLRESAATATAVPYGPPCAAAAAQAEQ